MLRFYAFLLLITLSTALPAQSKYWVFFKDKNNIEFNPYSYFDQKAIDKRVYSGVDLFEFENLPLNEQYCAALESFSEIGVKSRWLNAVSVVLSPAQLKAIENLPFVSGTEMIDSQSGLNSKTAVGNIPDEEQKEHISNQKEAMGGHYFSEREVNGKGVRIAIFDAGFPGVDTLSWFKQIRDEGRIIATYDFVKKREFVYNYNFHGTGVFACIAGSDMGLSLGLGTGAEFLLARTEVNAEVFSEEENWAAAVEWADKLGADIISSSLGYTFNRYFPRQMDGKHTFVSRMAGMAARKGILVINAAGNDGDKQWQVIGAPADADSILSVGGISSTTGIHSDFSSFGPTYDGRLKPEIVTLSDVITIKQNGKLQLAYGTSFAAPLAAGFAACVKQMHPGWSSIQLYREICKSGHLYPYYDYAHGYGVPQAAYFTGDKLNIAPTFLLEPTGKTVQVRLQDPSMGADTIMVLKDSTGNGMTLLHFSDELGYDTNITVMSDNTGRENGPVAGLYGLFDQDYLYYHFADKVSGKLRSYKVIKMPSDGVYSIDITEMKESEILRVHYKGYTEGIGID